MDYKQKRILDNLYSKYRITGKRIVFKQYRNLKEFTFFKIERINPNHKIKLLGQPKRKFIKDGHYNKLVNVGEIIIYGGLFCYGDYNIILFWLFSLGLTIFCFDLCILENPFEVLQKYVNRYRRGYELWQNCSISEIS